MLGLLAHLQTLGIAFASTPFIHLLILGDIGKGPSHQSSTCEALRTTLGSARWDRPTYVIRVIKGVA